MGSFPNGLPHLLRMHPSQLWPPLSLLTLPPSGSLNALSSRALLPGGLFLTIQVSARTSPPGRGLSGPRASGPLWGPVTSYHSVSPSPLFSKPVMLSEIILFTCVIVIVSLQFSAGCRLPESRGPVCPLQHPQCSESFEVLTNI